MSTTTSSDTELRPRSSAKPQLSDRAKSERKLGWKLAGPAFIVMLAVTAWPIIQAVYLSFFRYRLTDPDAREVVWLGNYQVILTDPIWWKAFFVTLLITVITVVVELVIGFFIAMMMHRVVIPRRTLRTIVLIPYSIITVVSAYAWLYSFRTDTGFINGWLNILTFGLVPDNFDWFGGFWPSIVAICLSEIWKTTPFMSLLLLAGLAQIDGAMEEAAKVDGATFWQRLFRVVLPNMKAAIMVAVLFRTLDAFRIFDNVFVMTGGANDTTTLSLLAYNATINRVEIGMGSAISVLLFLCVFAIALIFMKGFNVDLAGSKK
ncbi:carbohydrate ABC transporter permease [Ornithinimicrobium cryptoxanthini]|uniref:Sugar ABC transporter permease n=1 Tax=Ornithinimicrobium cryptoxanthini TaxID=2934161 RepID=A0ABY4YJY9_9MICO|nr:sugar ABC transporter permease [Ornithinimicrobium cryptoxanthini]USQ77064.1 sugar ABC transporter permease [Ornithinimicrobium cryptoxanthini]